MSKRGKRYDAKLKAAFVLSAIQGKKSELEICSEFKILKSNTSEWKNKLLNEMENFLIPDYVKKQK